MVKAGFTICLPAWLRRGLCNVSWPFWTGGPVGTVQLFSSAGVAGIYNVTCLPDARWQGNGAAVTWAALVEAPRLSYGLGVLQASSRGYDVYRRLGFRDYGKLNVYLWENHSE
jgi:hypothetical protein